MKRDGYDAGNMLWYQIRVQGSRGYSHHDTPREESAGAGTKRKEKRQV